MPSGPSSRGSFRRSLERVEYEPERPDATSTKRAYLRQVQSAHIFESAGVAKFRWATGLVVRVAVRVAALLLVVLLGIAGYQWYSFSETDATNMRIAEALVARFPPGSSLGPAMRFLGQQYPHNWGVYKDAGGEIGLDGGSWLFGLCHREASISVNAEYRRRFQGDVESLPIDYWRLQYKPEPWNCRMPETGARAIWYCRSFPLTSGVEEALSRVAGPRKEGVSVLRRRTASRPLRAAACVDDPSMRIAVGRNADWRAQLTEHE